MFILPKIDFQKMNFPSEETINFHYHKHHQAYIDHTNKLLIGNHLANATLEDIVTHSEGELFENAAQAWNHTFYWLTLSPGPTDLSYNSDLATEIELQFGGMAPFREKFIASSKALFGSGWTWLAYDRKRNKLLVINSQNAGNPMTQGLFLCWRAMFGNMPTIWIIKIFVLITLKSFGHM